MKKRIMTIFCVFLCSLSFSQEISRKYFGTVYRTVVNDNNVSIRELPNTNAAILGQKNKDDSVVITGYSISGRQ